MDGSVKESSQDDVSKEQNQQEMQKLLDAGRNSISSLHPDVTENLDMSTDYMQKKLQPISNNSPKISDGSNGSKYVGTKLSESENNTPPMESIHVSKADRTTSIDSPEEEGFTVKSVQGEKAVEESRKTKIHPIFSNMLINAMKKQKNQFPMVYIGAPNICDMRAYVKQQLEQKNKVQMLTSNPEKEAEKTTILNAAVSTNSQVQVPKRNVTNPKDIVETIMSTTATNVDDLQKVLDSLQDVKSPPVTREKCTVVSDFGWKNISNFDLQPSMVKVVTDNNRKPSMEAINFINQRNNTQQRRKTVVPYIQQHSTSKLQYSLKRPATSLSSPVASLKPAHVAIKKSRLLSPNHVISVPLTYSSKTILQITPSQTGITMSAKATKLSSSDALKVITTKAVDRVKPFVAKSVAVTEQSIVRTQKDVAVTKDILSVAAKNINLTAKISASEKTTSTVATNKKQFSVKVFNPSKLSEKPFFSTKLHNGVVKVFSSLPGDTSGCKKVTKVNHELQKQLQIAGIKRKHDMKNNTAKKVCISEKDTNVPTENKTPFGNKQDSKTGSMFKGKPGALVRFEDGVEMWIDKMREVTFVDDEPIKSWALKPGTEVAAKFSDGLFYDAVVVRSFTGNNNLKTEIGNDKKEHQKVNLGADPDTKAQVKTSATNKQIESNNLKETILNNKPQVQVEKLKMKVPAVIVVNNNQVKTNKPEQKPLAANVKKPSAGQKWIKCPNCFLMFIKVAMYQLHQKTVCGEKACMVENESLEQDKEVQVDESSVPPLVLKAKDWRKSGGKQLYIASDGRRWFKRGTRFLHRWQTGSGKSKWYNGMVRSVVGSNPKHPKCEFEVEYTDDDQDNGPYSIALYEDFPHDIRIVVR